MARFAMVLVVLLSACKTDNKPAEPAKRVPVAAKPPDQPPPPPVAPAADAAATKEDPAKLDDAELEAKGFTIVEKMGDLFLKDAKDCDKLAADLKAYIAETKPMMLQLSEMERRQTPEQQKAYNQRTKAKQDELMKRIQPAVDACKGNPNVQAAMAEIPE